MQKQLSEPACFRWACRFIQKADQIREADDDLSDLYGKNLGRQIVLSGAYSKIGLWVSGSDFGTRRLCQGSAHVPVPH